MGLMEDLVDIMALKDEAALRYVAIEVRKRIKQKEPLTWVSLADVLDEAADKIYNLRKE